MSEKSTPNILPPPKTIAKKKTLVHPNHNSVTDRLQPPQSNNPVKKKNKAKKKKKKASTAPPPQTTSPNPDSGSTQPNLHSIQTPPPSPSAPVRHTRPNSQSENRTTRTCPTPRKRPKPSVMSSIPPNCKNHESHTSTNPPDPPSKSCTPDAPSRNSVHHRSTMPPPHQPRDRIYFRVGSNHQQPRARPRIHPRISPHVGNPDIVAPQRARGYAYREANRTHSARPQHASSHTRRAPQYPSYHPDAMQIDRPAQQQTDTSNPTRIVPRNSNQPSTFRKSNFTHAEKPNRQTTGISTSRKAQPRTNRPTSQPTAAQHPPVTKALRKSLQKPTASPTGEYYGIRCGRDGFSGVATSWKSCSVFVVGYRDAVYELFDTWEKAERFSDRDGTGASLTHRSNFRHFFGGKRNGVMQRGSVARLAWEHENEPQVVSLVIGAACLRFGIGSGIGGYSVFLSLNNPYNSAGLVEGNVTEMRLQLKGLLEALEIVYQHQLVKDGGTVELYTASQEVKNGIDHWLGRWDRSGQWMRDGRPVGSQDIWKAILNIRKELLKKGTRIHTIWVKGQPFKVPALQQAIRLARVICDKNPSQEAEARVV